MRKTVLAFIAIFVIALMIVPVMAAKVDPLTEIFTIVKDYQNKMNTILTNLKSLQTDVVTIKSETDSINKNLISGLKPIGYEYYTGPLGDLNEHRPTIFEVSTTNWGDDPADVCVYVYYEDNTQTIDNALPICRTIKSKGSVTITPLPRVGDHTTIAKITSDSKYITPVVRYYLYNEMRNLLVEYLPGDFQKIEIYS
jgi:hypothetical protein